MQDLISKHMEAAQLMSFAVKRLVSRVLSRSKKCAVCKLLTYWNYSRGAQSVTDGL